MLENIKENIMEKKHGGRKQEKRNIMKKKLRKKS